jgi:hypothetical protein
MPSTYTVGAYAQYTSLTSVINEASAVDNCDDFVVITGHEVKTGRQYNRDCQNEYLLVRYFTATDNCGNTDTYSYSISAEDTQAPELPEIDDVTVECDAYEGYTDCVVVPTSAGDEDLEVSLYASTVQFENYFEVYKTWSVTDCAGQTAVERQTIRVVDLSKPIFSRDPDDVTVECSCDTFPAIPQLKVYDNCDEVTISFTETTTDGTCPDEYEIHRIWTATDNSGNTAEVDQWVSVYDLGDPEFCEDETDSYGGIECDKIPEVVKPQAKDDCGDVTVTQDGPPETVDVICDTAYTEYYTFTAVDDCGNTADYVKTLVIVDDTPPELVVDDMYCLFPTYGEKFGLWAVYDLAWLFRHEDNCDGAPLTAGSFHCNATDYGSVVTGVVPDTQCKIMDFNSVWKVFIKIDRHTDGPATHMGRTYSIYGEIADSCNNHHTRKREVFIPVSQAVYEHYQPCDTGNPEYETVLPITYTGFDGNNGVDQGGDDESDDSGDEGGDDESDDSWWRPKSGGWPGSPPNGAPPGDWFADPASGGFLWIPF